MVGFIYAGKCRDIAYTIEKRESLISIYRSFCSGGTIIGFCFVYFYVPETLGRSLEEITLLMELEVPTRAWKDYQTTVDSKPSEQWKAEEKGSRFAGGVEKGKFVENAKMEDSTKATDEGTLPTVDSK